MPGVWEKFPRKFHIQENPTGPLRVFEEKDNGVIKFSSEQDVSRAILKYFKEQCYHIRKTSIKISDCKEAFHHWSSCRNSIEKIHPVLELNEPGLTFRRLPWDLTAGNTPLFDEMLGRMTNSQAFMLWVGSLFFEKSDRSQYLWLYGTGRNGKSTLANELHFVFGDACSSEVPPGDDDRFWTAGLLGKRLVVFSDCKKAYFPTSDLFKQLTGGDKIRMEKKGQQPFYSEISAKFLFLSNDRPQISRTEADMRRAIFCEIGKIKTDFGEQYPELLRQELPHFLYNCKMLYKKNCRGVSVISVAEENFEEIISQEEELFEDFLSKHFVLDPDTKTSPNELNNLMNIEKWNEARQQRFRKWLEISHGVKRRTARDKDIAGKTKKMYHGIRRINFSYSNPL